MAFTLVKYAGAAYLIYLGINALLSKEEFFIKGLTMNLLNPKVAVFFLAFLPQFANPGSSGTALRLVVIGLVFALLSVVVFSAIALFSGVLGDRLSRNPRYTMTLRWLTGCVLVGLGLRLALSGRR
jgi:threonine/homoserine/homoserine lactone efflux protein